MFKRVLIIYLYLLIKSLDAYRNEDVKCLVCKTVVQEMETEVSKVNPMERVDVSGFRLDAKGNAATKSIPLVKSEIFLTDLMERICDRMEDYVKATYKTTGRLTLLKLEIDGNMNPESSNVNFVQDDDLNKSLKHYCLDILDNGEEAFMKLFQADSLNENLDIKICSEETNYCKDAPLQEDYAFEKQDL